MAFRMFHLVLFAYVLCMPFMILAYPAEVGNMSIHDYINYVNPPAVHKYKHDNGDSILCVKFTDQISLRSAKQQSGYDKNYWNMGWRDTQAGEPSSNISGSGLGKKCPKGTVSVREIKYEHVKEAGSVNMFLRRKMIDYPSMAHEYAVLQYTSASEGIYSAQGRFNIWEPYVAPNGFSLSQIWLVQEQPITQPIEAGWEVYPSHYGDSRPRLFVYWTNDNYQSTGCRDVDCAGFVLSNSAQNYLGQPIEQVSEYGKDPVEILISIKREILQGETIWSLYIQDKIVGYWPGSLFSSLAESTNIVQYGGEVLYSTDAAGTPFSKTHMGSGHFPEEGFSKASYIRDIQMHNTNNVLMYPPETIIVGKPLCYNLIPSIDNTTLGWGHYMFYGGPGGDNPSCLN